MSTEGTPAAGRDQLSDVKRALLAQRLRGGGASRTRGATIPRRTDHGPAPLSYAQQRLWFLDQLGPGSPFYNVPAALPFNFSVDASVLERSIAEIARRHAALRTSFAVENGQPLQHVAPEVEIRLRRVNLEHVAVDRRQAEIEQLAAEEARQPFDLSRGPLIRTTLITCGRETHVFLLTLHHAICDGWSIGVLLRELRSIYESLLTGRPLALPELPIQYADFAVWQREWLTGSTMQEQLAYWTRQLADLPTLDLRPDRPRPKTATFRGAFHQLQVPRDVSAEVDALARRTGCTPFMVLLTAFGILLHRYTGQDDIVIGAPIANRTRAETEPLIGFFVNTLVLRLDLSGDPTFLAALQRARDTTLDAYAHQDLPFEKLVETLQPERELSRNPLCQVTFQLQNAPTGSQGLPSIADTGLVVQRGTAIFDLAFSLWQTQDGFIGGMEFSTDLFDLESIEQFARHFERVCRVVTATPDAVISTLDLLSSEERLEVIELPNRTARTFPDDVMLHQLVERTVDRIPGNVALILEDRRMTFGELEQKSNQLAHWLRSSGVRADSIVAVCLERSFEMVIALLGVLKAGGAYLPLDPQLPPRRMAYITAEAGADLVLTTDRLLATLTDACLRGTALDRPGDWEGLPVTRPSIDSTPDSLAYVLYTSGSTGVPKGVMVPHSAIVNHMLWMVAEGLVTVDDRVLQRTPFTFDASIWELFAPLLTGGTMVLLPPGERADTGLIADTIERHRVTVLQLVPSLLSMLLDDPAVASCRSLQRVFCGGEALTTAVAERLRQTLQLDIYNLYGPTEAAIDATSWKYQSHDGQTAVPIGRPIANTRLYVLDQQLRPLPYGVRGDIWIGGRALARGYVNSPSLTSERFRNDPYAPAPARMYRTGDVGVLRRSGIFEYVGRADSQVKLRGYRVELGEIETVLQEHPAINQAVAVAREDLTGDARLVAYVVRDPEYRACNASGEDRGDRLVRWRAVFDEVYSQETEASPTFDTTGWNSTYTGQPIPAAEMREWLDHTVTRVASLPASDVLEIGCGTGMLLFALAPRMRHYTAHDFSPSVVESLRQRIERSNIDPSKITLDCRAAHDLDHVTARSFDLVILNSVVQYFPSVDYLVDVLGRIIPLIRDGGFVFLGDVYSLPLRPAFALSVELTSCADDVPVDELRGRIRRRLANGKELALDPAFFTALRRVLPPVQGVWLQPKRGHARNEMNDFRYDVVLQVGPTAATVDVDHWVDWSRLRPQVAQVQQLLAESYPRVCAVSEIANARVLGLVRAITALSMPDAVMTAADVRRLACDAEAATHPEDWFRLESTQQYRLELRWDRATDGAFSVFACRRDTDFPAWAVGTARDPHGDATITAATLRRFANTPASVAGPESIETSLKQSLAERLPAWMIPSSIMVLERLPLTRSGKLDRAALPDPDWSGTSSQPQTPPRTALDELLCGVMADVLRTPYVGIHDNFFTNLGGHSLLATQFAARVREALSIEFPLRLVFETPTPAGIADALTRDPAQGPRLQRLAELLIQLDQAAQSAAPSSKPGMSTHD